MKKAEDFAQEVGYPVLVRPSFVLSGAGMKVAYNHKQLVEFLGGAVDVSPDHPVVMTKFLLGARELELDAVANKGHIVNWAISEHVEDAGVHSGDATMICPPDTVTPKVAARLREVGSIIASALKISGPMNVQYLWKGDEILVIECNLRASRSFPFVSKVYDINFIETATKIFLQQDVKLDEGCGRPLDYTGCKAPQFSFQRIHGSDPVLGVEMASTGEVACFGRNKYEAFLKAYLSVPSNFKMPKNDTVILSGNLPKELLTSIQDLQALGYKIHGETAVLTKLFGADFLKTKNVTGHPSNESLFDLIQTKKADIVFNYPDPDEEGYNYLLRRKAVDFGVPLMNNLRVSQYIVESLKSVKQMHCESYEDYYNPDSKRTKPTFLQFK